jgi:hypothetical protein
MGRTAHHYLIFETAGGFCGIAWNSVGITRFRLPTRSAKATERILLRRVPGRTNLVAAGGVARGWDSEFESALLQRRVRCEPWLARGGAGPLPDERQALRESLMRPNGELPSDQYAARRTSDTGASKKGPSPCPSSLRVLRRQGAAKHSDARRQAAKLR